MPYLHILHSPPTWWGPEFFSRVLGFLQPFSLLAVFFILCGLVFCAVRGKPFQTLLSSSFLYGAVFCAGFFAWVLAFGVIYFEATEFLPADGFTTHFTLFSYLASAWRDYHQIPDWVFTPQGGMWLGPLANNYLLLMPYRFLGYVMGAFLPLNLAYKFSFLLIGQGVFFLGLYLALSVWLKSRGWAFFGLCLAFFSSLHLGNFHQEQTLGTMFWIPWIAWAIKRSETPQSFYLACALFGVALNSHYPHLYVLYGLLLGLAAVGFYRQKALGLLRAGVKGPLWLGLTFLLLCSLPLWFSFFNYKDRMASDFREQKSSLTTKTFADYLTLNRQQFSSVEPANFSLYFGTAPLAPDAVAPLDLKTFYVTPLIVFAVLFAFFSGAREAAFSLVVIGGLTVLSMGIYTPLVAWLWHWVPGVGYFRQWFHFIPLLNLHLLFLILWSLQRASLGPMKNTRWVFAMVTALVLGTTLPISPFYSAVSVGFLALAGPRFMHLPTVRGAALSFVLGFGFFWSVHCLSDFRRYMILVPTEQQSWELRGQFANRAALYRAALPTPLLANVRGEVPSTRGIFWTDKEGRALSEASSSLNLLPERGGYRVYWNSRPAGAVGLNWFQWNDGAWKVQGGEVRPGAFLNFDLSQPQSGSIWIGRERSAWWFLVLLSQALLGVLGALVFKRRGNYEPA